MCSAKGSLLNKYTAGDNGVTTTKAVDVSDVKGDIVLSLKNTRSKSKRRPENTWDSCKLKGGVEKAVATCGDKVQGYWAAKDEVAKRRVSKLLHAQKRARKIQRK